jgi:K+-transporting ATPase KdpF subunit
MTLELWAGAAMVLVLFVYLIVVLLRPERF